MASPLPAVVAPVERTEAQLEEFLIFSVMVAGKPAWQTERKVRAILAEAPPHLSPLGFVRFLASRRGALDRALRRHRTGQYRRIGRALAQAARTQLDLRTCPVAALEAIPGIGPKTARFFLLYTRPGVRLAALDTHVLRWLREQGYDAPRSTPGSPARYRELELCFLAEACSRGLSPRDLDAQIWMAAAWAPPEAPDDATW